MKPTKTVRQQLWGARAARALAMAARHRELPARDASELRAAFEIFIGRQSSFRRAAETSTRAACASQSSSRR